MSQECPLEPALMVPQLCTLAPADEYVVGRGDDDGEHSPFHNAGVVESSCICKDLGDQHQRHLCGDHVCPKNALLDQAFQLPD